MTASPSPEFLWGAATAGHQVEGGNSTSDTWFLEHQQPSAFQEPSDRACDSFNRWAGDLSLVAELGLTAHRFSVEWARVEPEPGRFDPEALAHYAAVVDGCRQRGLAPVVTYNHFAAPHWFAARGGFLNKEAPELFARYCARVTEAFGDRIAFAMTLNEPNLHRILAWVPLPDVVHDQNRVALAAASEAAGVDRYRVANVVLPEEYDELEKGFAAGHVAARDAIRAVRPDLPVGFSLAMSDDVVLGDDPTVRDAKRAECYDHWLRLAADDDFFGVQNYARSHYDGDGPAEPDPPLPRTEMGVPFHPESLAACVSYAHEVARVPILVTEHGVSSHDDTVRADFIPPAIEALLALRDAGTPVLGYLHWSLLDNFEWVFGYSQKFGLVEVDRTTFERTPKPSARVYADVVARSRRNP